MDLISNNMRSTLVTTRIFLSEWCSEYSFGLAEGSVVLQHISLVGFSEGCVSEGGMPRHRHTSNNHEEEENIPLQPHW